MDQPLSDELLTVGEAAAVLDLTATAVRKLEGRGLLPATRTRTGVRLFKIEDVERLKRLGEQRPTRWHPYPAAARFS